MFGIKEYKTPREFAREPQLKISKLKRNSFAVTIPKLNEFVPGPGHNHTSPKWSDQSGFKHSKFVSGAKNTYLDIIQRNSRSPEKSTPGLGTYNDFYSLKKMTLPKIHGGESLQDIRTTFVDAKAAVANETPGPKYKMPNLVSWSW